jgi:hypothetical protein
VGEHVLAVVDDDDPEPDARGDRRDRLRDVSRPDQDEPRLRVQILHEHLHRAAAAHAQVAHEVGLE